MSHSPTPQCPTCHIDQLLSTPHATQSESSVPHMPHSLNPSALRACASLQLFRNRQLSKTTGQNLKNLLGAGFFYNFYQILKMGAKSESGVEKSTICFCGNLMISTQGVDFLTQLNFGNHQQYFKNILGLVFWYCIKPFLKKRAESEKFFSLQ